MQVGSMLRNNLLYIFGQRAGSGIGCFGIEEGGSARQSSPVSEFVGESERLQAMSS